MNRYLEEYKARQCTVDDVLAAIRDRDFVATSGGVNAPLLFYKNLHKVAPRLKQGIDFFYGTTYKKGDFEFLESQACKGKIRTLSGFVLCKDERGYIQEGRVDYVPTHYHSQGMKMIQARGGLDVYVAAVCPMDERTGYFRTSLSNVNETDFRNSAKKIFLEVVPSLPVIYGNNEIHVSEADGIYEYDHPLETMDPLPFGEVEKQIGSYVAELVEDGSTIQLGIGNIPNAVAKELRSKRHLGIHTEMFTETMVDLIECGAVDNSQKGLLNGYSVCSFTMGSQRLYDYVNNNPSVLFKSCTFTNDPYTIGKNNKFVSVNASLEIDLTGQCASETVGNLQWSGTGGQSETVQGSQMSPGGKSIIAMHSTYTTKDESGKEVLHSKIVPFLARGAAVTTSRNDTDYVVTEYGIAWLRGLNIRQRVDALIRIAHPDFRDWLREEAEKNMIW